MAFRPIFDEISNCDPRVILDNLPEDHSFIILNQFKSKIYDNTIIPLEQNSKTKEIFKLLDITIPSSIN